MAGPKTESPSKEASERKPRWYRSTWFLVTAIIAIILQSGLLLLALFGPGLGYQIPVPPPAPLESPQFHRTLAALSNAQVYHKTKLEVFTNGEQYYEAELAAIREAKYTINLEAYIFQEGQVTKRFVDALTERARNKVKVNLVIDAIGSLSTGKGYFKSLTDAGGEVHWYHPLRWTTWPRINNRTHRELIIIDGRVGFIGGAGFADHWLHPRDGKPRWRDTMVRVEGDAVAGLQSTFAENWLEASGKMMTSFGYFPFAEAAGETKAMVVDSSPTAGSSTRARMMIQLLIASARQSIEITTPYFLPDDSLRDEMVRAIKRGVKLTVIVPGQAIDHQFTRRSSRRLFGDLLRGGAAIYEYQPTMIHCKSLIVDREWGIIGSTNFDPRSFGLNDEVNLAAFDPVFAARLHKDFTQDLAQSRQISLQEWENRPFTERFHESLSAILERQQ